VTVHLTGESVSGGVKAALTQAYRQAMNQTWMIPVILVIVALLLVFALIGIFS
jgi:signal transduction histidine kinase